MKVGPASNGTAPGAGGLGATAGGDVGGTLPGATVVQGIQGVPVDPSAATPADRDALIYDAGTSAWIAEHVQAEDVDYDPTISGLAATNVKAAIDELAVADVAAGMPPIELLAGEIFVIPDRRQSLFSASLVFGIGSGVSIGSGSAFIEAH